MNTPSALASVALFTWGVYSTNAPCPPVDQRIIQEARGGRTETSAAATRDKGDNRKGQR